jgi:hypothetical protein
MPGLVLAAAAFLPQACTSSGALDDWGFDSPPFVAQTADASQVAYVERPVVVIGRFDDPRTPSVRWRDIGAGMSQELGRAMLNQGRYRLAIDLTRAVTFERVLEQSTRRNPLEGLRESYPQATFVIVGRVTDFHDTGDLPKDLSRQELFGRKREGIVAIEFLVIDLRSGQVVIADHVAGAGDGAKAPSKDLYRNISFGSYLFWSTPLGEASRQAIESVVQCVNRLLPAVANEVLIVKHLSPRMVEIAGGVEHGIVSGKEYYVCRRRGPREPPQPITDVDTGQPLMAHIDEVKDGRSTAWIKGRVALQSHLEGAVLRADYPLPVADALDQERLSGAEATRDGR